MDLIADTIAKLKQRFARAEVRKPSDPASVDAIADNFGRLPPELVAFLGLSDGLDLHLRDCVVGKIYGVSEMTEVLRHSETLRQGNLIPVRGDGCGNYDCVDIGVGPTNGAVLFWDHEVGNIPAYLLGGDFAAYLHMWSHNVMARFFESGDEDPSYRPKRLNSWPWIGPGERVHPWPFDEQWMRERDPRADLLLGNPLLRSRLVPTKSL